MINVLRLTPIMDKSAISASAICAVHCLCLPLLLGVFPALSTSILGQELFHQSLLWVVIPLSVIALTMGCRRHNNLIVALLGLAGLSALVLAASMGHEGLGENGERIATLMGALAIAAAHVRNYILCKQSSCHH